MIVQKNTENYSTKYDILISISDTMLSNYRAR